MPGLGQVRYELLPQNFTCPDFHTCTMVDSLKACEDYLGSSVKGICQSVSTHFIEMVGKSCGFKGRSICYDPSGIAHAGPDKVMVLVHNELNEKVYQYAAENFAWLALGGVTTIVLAYGSYKLIKEITATPKFLETVSKEQLAKQLDKAKVSNGHWNGNQICFDGESQKVTFSQVSKRIEEIYSESVNFMRKRQETYEWSQKPTRPGLHGISGLVISAPFMMLEAGAKLLASTTPNLNAEEEQQVQDAMQWRKDRYAQLNTLFQQSQDQVNKNSSYIGKVWNRTLDKLGSWREISPKKDSEIFDQMVKAR